MVAEFDMTRWRDRLDHLQTNVIPRQREQVRAVCQRFEQTLLEQYPEEAACIVLEPECSRLHFNDQGLSVESFGQVQRFTIPASRTQARRVLTRPLKRRDLDYSVVALLEASYEVQKEAMLRLPDLACVILARHGRGDLVEAWRPRTSTDGQRLPREREHQSEKRTEEHESTGVFDDRVCR